MIHQTFKGQDFLPPNQCLHLFGAGLTNKTAFSWILNEAKTIASLEFRTMPHEAVVENEFIELRRVPAFSALSLLSFLPNLIITCTNGRYEVGMQKNADHPNLDLFTEAATLNDAAFQLITEAVKQGVVKLRDLNAHLHGFNNNSVYACEG